MDFKCKKPPLVTVVLKLTEISLKPQLIKNCDFTISFRITVTNCSSQLVIVVLQLFLIRTYFNSVIILILFLKYFFIKITIML